MGITPNGFMYPEPSDIPDVPRDIKALAEQIDALYSKLPIFLKENANIYVAKSGNDITGDGSINKPFFTISKAIDLAKTMFGPWYISILVGDGAYAETLYINNMSTAIAIDSLSGRTDNVIISGNDDMAYTILATANPYFKISNITITGKSTLRLENGNYNIVACKLNPGGNKEYSAAIMYRSNTTFANCDFINCAACLNAADSSVVSSVNCVGSNNSVGASANVGIITLTNTVFGATTETSASRGGQIFK